MAEQAQDGVQYDLVIEDGRVALSPARRECTASAMQHIGGKLGPGCDADVVISEGKSEAGDGALDLNAFLGRDVRAKP